jgi:TRAP-type mannitol/chloroaromatic compound transport system permease small subunit
LTVVPATASGTIERFCRLVDRLNERVGRLFGPVIVFIAASIIYEVVSRGAFGVATIWVSEASVYGASAVYLLAGGYALLHRRHVRIDLVLGALSPRLGKVLDLVTFPFLLLYAGTLVWVGLRFGMTSYLQNEGTGTPWNPPIWPIKFCIPVAGLLLILQAFANLFRDLGLAPPTSAAPSVARAS